MKKNSFIIIFLIIFNVSIFRPSSAEEEEIKDIFFPTEKISTTFVDSHGDGRYDHSHEGTDIMGEQMTPLYAAVDGYISYIVIPEASWGYSLTIRGADGYTYHYLHMNNDNPGTDDGAGGVEHAYAPGLKRGVKVERGQLVGWMGDSGNAESVGSHLHFEIRRPDKTAINAYQSLIAALSPGNFNPEGISDLVQSINDNRSLSEVGGSVCESDTLIKISSTQAVYYCGADGKRYVFPNDKTYFTWYDGFDNVNIISDNEMADIPLGGNVTYRPGVKMIKIQTSPKVYVVDRGGVLRWVKSAETAELLYGSDWNKFIDDVPDSFYFDYVVGEPIE